MESVRVAELVASLSYAADLGLGQPLSPCMRQTVIALRLADLAEGSPEDRAAATYYTGLLMNTYCHADATEQVGWFGDEISLKREAFGLLGKPTAYTVAFLAAASPATVTWPVGLSGWSHCRSATASSWAS